MSSVSQSDSRQKSWPKVIVPVVNWNGEHFLKRGFAALLAQTVTPNAIILVDNSSTDDSIEIVRRFPLVRLITQEVNTGFARGNNWFVPNVCLSVSIAGCMESNCTWRDLRPPVAGEWPACQW